jgi:hypothetical protein
LRGVERDYQLTGVDFANDGKVARAWRVGIPANKSDLTNIAMVFEEARLERSEMRVKSRPINQLRRFWESAGILRRVLRGAEGATTDDDVVI